MTDEKSQTQTGEKRGNTAGKNMAENGEPKTKKGRGRPKGSKNKTKEVTAHMSRGQRLSARRAAAEKANKHEEKSAE